MQPHPRWNITFYHFLKLLVQDTCRFNRITPLETLTDIFSNIQRVMVILAHCDARYDRTLCCVYKHTRANGTRGTKGGQFMFAAQDWQGEVPASVDEVVRVDTYTS